MKSLPVTVSENAEAPSVADDGLIVANTGAGLLTGAGSIVKVCGAEVPPPGPGLNTVTDAVPALAISAAVIAACSSSAET